jgi:fumarylacetoacetase
MSWFRTFPDDPFGVTELPYGVFQPPDESPRVGVAVGSHVIDLAALAEAVGDDSAVFARPSLNDFLAQGPAAWAEHRALLVRLLRDDRGRAVLEPHLRSGSGLQMLLPIEVADYVDFYASEHHASNVGQMFRPDDEPLTPNWRHLPIAYHGRAGTVVVTGTDVVRPSGQRKAPADPAPIFGPSQRLDFEVELGFVVGVGSRLGTRVATTDFERHVFGIVILNDWSARDLQAWEYVPLGPFLGKSFATSISGWVLPLAALDQARIGAPERPQSLLEYLDHPEGGYDIDIEVRLNGQLLATCPYAHMYYSPAQMLAHLTSNGASLRTGDLFGSGTVSGPAPDQHGSLLELTWNGTRPLQLADGERTFLRDGDEVVMRASAPTPGGRVRLGEVRGRIVPTPAAT